MSVNCKAFGALAKKYPLSPEDSLNLREAVQKKVVLKDILFGSLKETDIPSAIKTHSVIFRMPMTGSVNRRRRML